MKRLKLLLILILVLLLAGCRNTNKPDKTQSSVSSVPKNESQKDKPESTDVASYFPILKNVRYDYEGKGNEYATYSVWVDYTSETGVQQRTNNGGTESVSVIEVADGKVTRLLNRAETYYRENFLNKDADKPQVLLMKPIAVGTSWMVGDTKTRKITGVCVQVKTPSGNYNAVEVRTKESDDAYTLDYYAVGVGLVKSVYINGDLEVSSTLSKVVKDVSFTQVIRFFYPNAQDYSCYYLDREISFKTNDVTKFVLQAAYKEMTQPKTGTVFSANTKINWLYLNQDGVVHIDLSSEFVNEMNAGSGYEANILRCVTNTFGRYYGVDRVYLTINGGFYESGHITLGKGKYLTVNTTNSSKLS